MTPSLGIVTVGEIMTPAPVTVRRDTCIEELYRLFRRLDFNGFPVVDDDGALCGVVSELDLLRLARWARRRRPAARRVPERVGDIMSDEPVGVDVGASVDAAGDLMLDHRLRSLPVTDRARGKPLVVGILSRTDLLRSVATGAARPRGEPRPRARPARRP